MEETVKEEIIEAYVMALANAHDIHERFRQKFDRPPTQVETAMAATLYIESNKRNGRESGPATFPQADNAPHTCAQCNGPIWDNRADKAAGKVSAKYPDWKCKDQTCGWVAWADSKKPKPEPEPEPEVRGPVEDPEGSSLPF